MPDISGINGPNGPDPIRNKTGVNRSGVKKGNSYSSPEDSVEISSAASRKAEAAEFVSKLKELPEIRQARVEDIKNQIENGTYNADAKLGQALDGLLQDIGLSHLK